MRQKLVQLTLGNIAGRLWSLLPSGGSLPDEVWRSRHRFLVGLTWFHAVIIALLGLILSENWEVSLSAIYHEDTLLHAVSEGLLVGGFAFLGSRLKASRALRAALVGLGLISSSAILVHLFGGYIELHFHFFVMLTFLALYQDWFPFGLSILYVAVHHGVVGVLWPTEVYNHPAAIESPWTWAGIHAFFVLWASVGSVIAWRLNEAAIARTKLILNSAGEGIFGVDADGKAIFVNPAAEKMLGYQMTDLNGRSMHDVLRHARADETPCAGEECPVCAVLKDATVHQASEEVFRSKDGTGFPVDYVSTPIIEGGELRGAVVTFRDVSQRQQAERAQRESELRFRQMAENIKQVFWITDTLTNAWLYVSPAYGEIWGRSAEALGPMAQSWLGAIHPEDLERVLAAVRTKQVTGSYDEEYRIVRPDGSIRWIRDRAFPVRNDSGRNYRVAGIAEDITERKRAEEDAERNLERLRALRDIDHAISSSLDLRTVLAVLMEKIDLVLPYAVVTVRLFNKASGLLEPVACRNLDENEWKEAQWRGGRGISNVVFEGKAPLIIRDTLADARVVDGEFYRKHSLISYVGVPLTVKEDTLGVLGFYTKEEHDFTGEEVEFLMTLAGQAAVAIHNSQIYEEMAQLAVDLASSNKVKDEFLSVMSHELRTPLNVVMGYAAMIKDKLLGEVSPEQSHVLDKLMSRMRSQLDMVNGILQATQIQAHNVTIDQEEVSVANLLNELQLAYRAALDKPVKLIWDYSPDLPAIQSDGKKLKQILANLVDNAIKFTDEGRVTVSARVKEGDKAVELRVEDTGRGIPAEALPIIFEKFRQADSSETRLHGGIGLGLYIAKNFAELLGGAIKVETAVGKGSVFTVTIPCSEHSSKTYPPGDKSTASGHAREFGPVSF
jgi:PAS domain S-box-containing protein